MARIARFPSQSEIASPSLTSSATQVNVRDTRATRTIGAGVSNWAKEAWSYYDSVGELRYVCSFLTNSLSQAALVASDVDPATGQPTGDTEDDTVAQIVADIAGGPAGQSQMLGRLATFLTVPGEGWVAVIARQDENGAQVEEWHVLSAEEMKRRGQDVILALEDGTDHLFDPDTDLLTRVHRPHPRNAREADSPVRAALPILSEIVRVSQAIEGAGKSRLAGNGILLLPQEISMPVAEAPTPDPDAPGLPPSEPVIVDRPVSANDVMQQLQEVMTTAISDRASAAALVPIVLKGPGEVLDKIRHVKFESDVTDTALTTRDKAIHRLALSLDVPQEVLTGMSGANHWSAWQIDEAAIKTHIAPMMTVICDALTEAVLRPLLRAVRHPNPENVVIWYDLTKLSQRPDRSNDAVMAFDRGAIGSAALRRELGFSDTDAVTDLDEEARFEILVEMVRANPALFPSVASLLGFDLPDPPAPAQSGGVPASEPGADTRTPPQRAASTLPASRGPQAASPRPRPKDTPKGPFVAANGRVEPLGRRAK